MVSGINAALSGFAAATKQLNASANNIANQFSTQTTADGSGQTVSKPYVPQKVTQSSQASGGVNAQQVPDPSSPNDPAQQLVQGNIASYDAKANLKSIQVQSETLKQVLDIIS